MHLGRGRPVELADFGHGVIVGHTAGPVARLVGQDAVSANCHIRSIRKLSPTQVFHSPVVRIAVVVLIRGIRLPIQVNTSPCRHLRLIKNGIVVLVHVCYELIVVLLVEGKVFAIEIVWHVIQGIFHVIEGVKRFMGP